MWRGGDGNGEGLTGRERGETGRGQWGGDNGEGAMGREQRRWGQEGARGGRISQMDMMECLGGHRL